MTRNTFEFIALMASLMAMAALSIDAILPALSIIESEFNSLLSPQLLILTIFLGLGLGQLVFGPLSDSFGRKPMIYIGLAIFTVASIVCVYAWTMEVLLLGRLLQGIGLSAPRTISSSMIRDCYDGNHMARIMSFITVVFIMVPTLAPLAGKLLLDVYGWKSIFIFQLAFCILVVVWFYFRQQETLNQQYRIGFSKLIFINGFKEIVRYKSVIVYTLISGFVLGSFMLYLSASEEIFVAQYGLKDSFPYLFAGLALAFGVATFINGSLVVKYGMERIISTTLKTFSITAIMFLLFNSSTQNPSIYHFLIFLLLQFISLGFLFGNLNAARLEPIGHIAGIGAAITGFTSTLIAVGVAVLLGSFINDTVYPLFFGFAVCGSFSMFLLFLLKYSVKQKTHP